jgi:WD40 repeat protein
VARLFISHSKENNAAAIALANWLSEQGFDDLYLDIDPARGTLPGQRWQETLKAAADRCEAVLFLISPAWLASKWCLAEFLLARSLHKRIFGVIVDPVPLEQVPAEMTAEWQLCELVGADRFRSFKIEVFGNPAEVAFREAGLDLLRRGLERAGLDAQTFPWPPPSEPNRAPYRGLKALEPQDAAIFFGRDAWIVRGVDRIRGLVETGVDKLLVVLGASGSGKSSFLRAGLWPRLARDDASFLPLPVIRPQTAVISGSTGLAAALSGAFERLGVPRPRGVVRDALSKSPDVFGGLLDELLVLAKRRLAAVEETRADPVIILPVDQAEELFMAEGGIEAATFLDLLAGVLVSAEQAPARRLLVVATMRSDRYELLQAEPRLASVKQELLNLPPLPAAEFKSIIEGPAHRVREAGGRLEIDAALTEQLVADAQGADALPLLGFTLERLYTDYGSSGRLTLVDYEKLGGVQGSLEAAVSGALADPGRPPVIPADKEAQLALLRTAFIPWLARIDPDSGAPMRRVARLDEIPEESRAIVERLVAARLLLADRRAGGDVIEVAHESLLRQWPALTTWLDADSADLKLVEGVERAAGEWDRNGRLEAWLDHRADRLAAADRLLGREDFRRRLGEDGAAYLAACRAREAAERAAKEEALAREQARLAEIAAAQARTARLQRRGRWALAAIAVAVLVGLGIGAWQRQINFEQHQANLALQSDLEVRQRALDEARVNLMAELAASERSRGNWDAALRLAVHGARLGMAYEHPTRPSLAVPELAAATTQSPWTLTLSGHSDGLWSAVFSPDGTRILTASKDGTARIWDAATGHELASLRGSDGEVHSAFFSPDGKRIVTTSLGTMQIWDAATAKEIAVLRGRGVVSAAFSADGSRIVTASADKSAAIWDTATGKPIRLLQGHTGPVMSAAFSPDGSRIVTASYDETARIWDAATAKEVAVLRGHGGYVYSAAFSPDGSRIATASGDTTARIWDAATGAEIAVLRGHNSLAWSAGFSPDGSRVVTASVDGTARIWDAATGKEIVVLRGHEGYVFFAAFSPDSSHIVTASSDKTARIWDAAETRALAILRGHTEVVISAAFGPAGSRIVTASQDDTARIWDASTGQELAILRGHEGWVMSAEFSPDGSRIITASSDKTVRIWDVATGKEIGVLRGHEAPVNYAAESPDGLRIVSASDDKTARIWDAVMMKEVAILRGREDKVQSASFSPDGSRIVTAASDNTARIWDAATGAEIAVLHALLIRCAKFSPDGSRIVTSSTDGAVRIWDAASAKELAVMQAHQGFLVSVAFSPDGSRIATAGWDKTARIWDVATAKDMDILRGHEGEVWSAAFSPDGSRLVTASFDKTARIWDVHLATMPAEALIAEACTRRLGALTQLTREEMRVAGYPDDKPETDVCEGVE